MTNDAFSKFHPAVNFAFFIAAILLGVVFQHPAYLAASLIGAGAYYMFLNGRKGLKMLALILPLFVFITAINPVFNTYGEHILFRLFGRPYTFEALCYGASAAAMLAGMLLWFGCYNAVMTSDKFWGLFGGIAPSISLLLVMVLRMVPNLFRKAKQLAGARKSIGKGAAEGAGKRARLEDGLLVLGALTSWAFEGGVVTSDSMRARGFGTGKRSSFNVYSFGTADVVCLAVMALLVAAVIAAAAGGSAHAEYTPVLDIAPISGKNAAGLIAYCAFVLLPAALRIREDIKWHSLRSGI
ncbi:MAG: energy-coupling factor transporter transmembrane protein EcfT [Firmicutes bacterium]|nr:energy-coupling factor transporter transmembrane protein EcfT [Bacillota bacterium]